MMKKILLSVFAFFLGTCLLYPQAPLKYAEFIKEAEKCFEKKEYKKSAELYAKAFKSNLGKALCDDRYAAAQSWAMSNNPDSAFVQLTKIATVCEYVNYNFISMDSSLSALHIDKRWAAITQTIKQNIGKDESLLNKSLVVLLDSVYCQDQSMRLGAVKIKNEYGWNSKESEEIWKKIHKRDSINMFIVSDIIETYGWLGKEIIGTNGNATLAMVIMHSDILNQKKYLPKLLDAVKVGKANPQDYAMIQDRLLLKEGKKQLYGSVTINLDGKKYYISPLEDPSNVDARRAELGLDSYNDYLDKWNLKWDINQYKNDLALIESKPLNYADLFFEK